MTNAFEKQYLEYMTQILQSGTDRPDRTGVGSRFIWGGTIRHDLSTGEFPAITTRKVSPRLAFEETWFFLRGETDTKILEEKNIKIWKGNTNRQFLDSRGLSNLPEGNLGKGYGFQWRNFGGSTEYDTVQSNMFGVDQLSVLLKDLKADKFSRRHIITAWNPQQIHEMALPPCHLYQQYQVTPDNKLNSMFLMRSNDFLYGFPFNMMGYAFLNVAIAKLCGYTPGELVYMGTDVHLYSNQLEIAAEQIKRIPKTLPTITIVRDINTIEDLLSLQYSDFAIENYDPYPDFTNKPPMAI